MAASLYFRIFGVWTLSLLPAFAGAGFIGDYHPGFFAIMLVVLFMQVIFGFLFNDLLGRAELLRQTGPWDFSIVLLLFTVLMVFVAGMFVMALRFQTLFDPRVVLLESGQVPPFALASLLAFPIQTWLLHMFDPAKNRLHAALHSLSAGILLACFFFLVYFIFASVFNQPVFDVDDVFFDTDGLLWRTRFTTDDYRDYYWRSVHPYVLLLIRPPIAFLSLFLNGDRLGAALLLTALAGAGCVFLAWFFIKKMTGRALYALLIASMLGASASHLVFGSLIETYIFLAAVMMIFLVMLLLQAPFWALLLPGLASFGITFTNFAQVMIALVFARHEWRQLIKYGIILLALVIPLTLLNNMFYPDSQPYFFVPSTLGAEVENTFAISLPRALAVGRVMFFHSIVAPTPLVLEEEIPFLKVWMFKADPIQQGEYRTWLGTTLAIFWLGLILVGIHLFIKNLRTQDHRFPFAFICILLFNFALHLQYGKDLFLYSTNWSYALVLFLALSWREWAGIKWFQIALLLFTALLLLNNSGLILAMLETSALHIK
jgi:hypothetical protein